MSRHATRRPGGRFRGQAAPRRAAVRGPGPPRRAGPTPSPSAAGLVPHRDDQLGPSGQAGRGGEPERAQPELGQLCRGWRCAAAAGRASPAGPPPRPAGAARSSPARYSCPACWSACWRPAGSALSRSARSARARTSAASTSRCSRSQARVRGPDLPALEPGEQVGHLVADERAQLASASSPPMAAASAAATARTACAVSRAGPGQHVGGQQDPPDGHGRGRRRGQHPSARPSRPSSAAITPAVSNDGASGRMPSALIRPWVGRRPIQPAGGGRGADRAAGVGAQAQAARPGRHRGGRAGRGAAGEPVRVQRVHRRGALARVADDRVGQLVELGQARAGRARGQQPGHRRRGGLGWLVAGPPGAGARTRTPGPRRRTCP